MNNNYRLFKLVRAVKPSAGGIDTSDATAIASDIAQGKTAYINGQKITGTITTIEAKTAYNQSQPQLRYDNNDSRLWCITPVHHNYLFRPNSTIQASPAGIDVANAVGLTADKLLEGNTVLGIEGTGKSLDTSDATATAEEIVSGKTAYVNGEKVTGVLKKLVRLDNSLEDEAFQTVDVEVNDSDELLIVGTYPLRGTTELSNGDMETNELGVGVVDTETLLKINIPYVGIADLVGITPDNIKKGVTILGVTGTYEGDFTETVTPEEYTQAETQISDLFGEEV